MTALFIDAQIEPGSTKTFLDITTYDEFWAVSMREKGGGGGRGAL